MGDLTGETTSGRSTSSADPAAKWKELDRKRGQYQSLIVGVIGTIVLYGAGPAIGLNKDPVLVANIVFAVAFLIVFLRTAKRCGFSNVVLVLVAVGVLLPLLSMIIVLLADWQVGKRIAAGWLEASPEEFARLVSQPRLMPASYWSVILSLIPFIGPVIGLPLALIALRAIAREPGKLKGRGWALTGIVLNTLGLLLAGVMVALDLSQKGR